MGEEEHKEKSVRKRSPNYPAIDLKSAVARIEQIYENESGQHFVPSVAIFSHWKCGAKSSAAITTLGALKQFGLLEAGRKKGLFGESRLTDLAMEILLDEDGSVGHRNEALKRAAMKPPLHAKVWQESEGGLPSDKVLRYRLIKNHGFTQTGASDFIKEFRSTLAFSKITKNDKLSDNGSEDNEGMEPSGRQTNAPQTRLGMKQDTYTLDEGDVVLQWPAKLSQEGYEDVKAWLDLIARKMKRSVVTDDDGKTEAE